MYFKIMLMIIADLLLLDILISSVLVSAAVVQFYKHTEDRSKTANIKCQALSTKLLYSCNIYLQFSSTGVMKGMYSKYTILRILLLISDTNAIMNKENALSHVGKLFEYPVLCTQAHILAITFCFNNQSCHIEFGPGKYSF